jgi:hypothetical protein
MLLLVGLVAYSLIAPPVRRARKTERAVRAQHPELRDISCRQLNPLDATIYRCSAKDGPWTSCIHVTGNLDHPIIDVSSHVMYPRGVKPSC